jgi:peptidyl-prolyl cis-trans isomerase SurA
MNLKNIFFGLLTLTFLQINAANTVENKILFKVNNEIITSMDIFHELKYLEVINDQFKNTDKNQAFEIAKKSLIKEKIKEIELNKFVKEIDLEDKFFKNILVSYFRQIEIQTIDDFEKYFISLDLDPELIKKKISIEVLWNDLIVSRYKQRVKINKETIVNDIQQNDKQQEFLLSEILFKINSNEKLDEKYQKIKDKIQNSSFSEAALTFSISDTSSVGGDLGWIKEKSISKKIKDSLQNINIGEHSNPILIPGGFLILKIREVKETNKNFDLNEEVERIIKEKTNEQLNQFSNIFFNKVQKNIIIDEL